MLDAFAAHPDYSVQQIADVVGCSRQTVWAIKEANGIKAGFRERNGAYTPEKEAYMVSIIRNHAGKSSIYVIADLCGCARSTVWRLMKKHGIDNSGFKQQNKGGRPKGYHTKWKKSRKTTLIGEL